MCGKNHLESDSCCGGPEPGPAQMIYTSQDPGIPLQEAPSHICKSEERRELFTPCQTQHVSWVAQHIL